jgi:hypothetical protein
MSLIVRDEAEFIAENIRYHAEMGVDCFAVLDNGSKDETYIILNRLRSDFDLSIFSNPEPLDKERQSMFLARHLREQQRADWLISNDADEFWYPHSGSLKDIISPDTPVLAAKRFNFLPRYQDIAAADYRFFNNIMLVSRPYGEQPPAPDLQEALLYPMMLRRFPGKILCALDGLERVHKGNHKVTHNMGEPVDTDGAVVFHYQIRGYDSFETRVRNHGETVQKLTGTTSWHLRRWYAAYLQGRLRQEYESLVLTEADVIRLRRDGVIREDRTMEVAISRLSPAHNLSPAYSLAL